MREEWTRLFEDAFGMLITASILRIERCPSQITQNYIRSTLCVNLIKIKAPEVRKITGKQKCLHIREMHLIPADFQ